MTSTVRFYFLLGLSASRLVEYLRLVLKALARKRRRPRQLGCAVGGGASRPPRPLLCFYFTCSSKLVGGPGHWDGTWHAGRTRTSWPGPPKWCALPVGGAAWSAARCRENSDPIRAASSIRAMAKRPADSVSGGTFDTVAAALASSDSDAPAPTDEQLDLLLPSDGFQVLALPASTQAKEPIQMTADEVHAFFTSRIGAPDEAYDAMCNMDLNDLEELQGIADDIFRAGVDDAAQQKGLDWSTLISTVIA